MINRYKKGRAKEQKIVKEARDKGLIAFRSAGSKSPIDCVTVDHELRIIELIQSKNPMPSWLKRKLQKEWKHLDGMYAVVFRAL